MKYRLAYTHRAAGDIRGLEENVKKRIGKALERYVEEPLKYASKLTDPALSERIDSELAIIELSLILRTKKLSFCE